MITQNFSNEDVLTAMIIWEHYLDNDNSQFYKVVSEIEGACDQRDVCVDLACKIEKAWDSLTQVERSTFISKHCENDCWDWEVVPPICNLIAQSGHLRSDATQIECFLKSLIN